MKTCVPTSLDGERTIFFIPLIQREPSNSTGWGGDIVHSGVFNELPETLPLRFNSRVIQAPSWKWGLLVSSE